MNIHLGPVLIYRSVNTGTIELFPVREVWNMLESRLILNI